MSLLRTLSDFSLIPDLILFSSPAGGSLLLLLLTAALCVAYSISLEGLMCLLSVACLVSLEGLRCLLSVACLVSLRGLRCLLSVWPIRSLSKASGVSSLCGLFDLSQRPQVSPLSVAYSISLKGLRCLLSLWPVRSLSEEFRYLVAARSFILLLCVIVLITCIAMAVNQEYCSDDDVAVRICVSPSNGSLS